LKLQKSLDHVTVELRRFQEDQVDRNNSSMLELILTPRKNKISDYTLNEWTDIQTNLKSSLIFMEQIIVSILLYYYIIIIIILFIHLNLIISYSGLIF